MPISAILVFGTAFFYLLESIMFCQPLPAYRHRHARINLVITAVNLVTLAGCGIGIAGLSNWVTANEFGLYSFFTTQDSIGHVPLFIAMVIVYDLVNYWIHRSQHMFAILWPLHRIHHSDPYLDVTSGFRFHPFESVYRALIQGAMVVALGMTVSQISVYLIFVVANLLFSHTNILLPRIIDRAIGWIFVTPDLHRVHHSVERRWHDSNYGIVLTIWDRLFQSYSNPDEAGTIIIGLAEYPSAENLSPGQILSDPFAQKNRPVSLQS